MNIKEIIAKMGFGEQAEVTVFKHEEDDSDYAVWKIEEGGVTRVLKKTSRQEPDVYNAFLASAECGAPRFYESIEYDGELFFLMEYIKGHNLQKCDRESLTAALDALIYLQNMYWEKRELQGIGHGFEASLPGRQKRGKYLNDAELEQAYEQYLRIYSDIPRTLCHDDLLPFNVLCADKRAVIIDWEYAGLNYAANDIACILCRDNFTEDQIDAYLKSFLGRSLTREEDRYHRAFIPIAAFYWFCWGLYKGSVGDDDGFFFLPAYRNLVKYLDVALESYENEVM